MFHISSTDCATYFCNISFCILLHMIHIYKWTGGGDHLCVLQRYYRVVYDLCYVKCKCKCNFESKIFSTKYMLFRCLMVSTDQADSRCFYFRISWILMEWRWFYFFHPLQLVQGLRSIEHWLLQKLSMKNLTKIWIPH